MPKVKGNISRVGGNARGSRMKEATGGPGPRSSAAADLDLGSQAPQSAAVGTGQNSVVSLMLDQPMDAVGLWVRQELSAHTTTLYLPRQNVGGLACRRSLTSRSRG